MNARPWPKPNSLMTARQVRTFGEPSGFAVTRLFRETKIVVSAEVSSESVARRASSRSVSVRGGSYLTRKFPAESVVAVALSVLPLTVKVIGLSGAKPVPLSRARSLLK
jgi:hypothetical protein